MPSIVAWLLRTGEVPDDDPDYMRAALATSTELTPAQIDTRVQDAVESIQTLRTEAQERLNRARAQEMQAQAKIRMQEATDAAIAAAETARRGAVWGALFLAVSSRIAGLAAWSGAIQGFNDRDAGRIRAGFIRRRG